MGSRQQVRERSDEVRQPTAVSVLVETSDPVAPKGDSMQHKSVTLLIKSADDQSGT